MVSPLTVPLRYSDYSPALVPAHIVGAGMEQLANTQEVQSPHIQAIATEIANELVGVNHMARGQQPPIAEVLHERIHTFFHRFYEMTIDGEVCEIEQEEALDELDAITAAAEYMAESQAAGLAMVRRGFDSKRAVELTGRMRRKERAA